MLKTNLLSLEDFYTRVSCIVIPYDFLCPHHSRPFFYKTESFSTKAMEQGNRQLFEGVYYSEYHIISLLSRILFGEETPRIKRIYAFKYLAIPESLCSQVIHQFITMAQYDTSSMVKKCLLHTLAYIGSSMTLTAFHFLLTRGFHTPIDEIDGTAAEARASLFIFTHRAKPELGDRPLIACLIEATQHKQARVRLAAVWALSHQDLIYHQEDETVFCALYRLATLKEPLAEVRQAATEALGKAGKNLLWHTDSTLRATLSLLPFASDPVNPPSFGW